MSSAYISTIAALVGSMLGGLTSLVSAWLTQQRQDHAARLTQDRARRRELYAKFIDEASRLYGDALAHNEGEISSLVGVYSLISQMRILSSPDVVASAEGLIRIIVETYFSPNKTLFEVQNLIDTRSLDPLRAFSEVCRKELNSF